MKGGDTMKTLRLKKPAVTALRAAGWVMMFLSFAIMVFQFVPQLVGYQEYVVMSEMMEPDIPKGSLILVTKADPYELMPGEIISFKGSSSDNTVVTYRITDNDTASEQVMTLADRSSGSDAKAVKYTQIAGRVRHVLPGFGNIFRFFAGGGRFVLLAVFILGFALSEAQGTIRKRTDKKKEADSKQ